MKNSSSVGSVYVCNRCNLAGFFCYTPCGADFKTCPCCGEYDFLNATVNYTDEPTKYDFLFDDENGNYDYDMRNSYSFCKKCKIIFELGCTDCSQGCTDDTYNCHFIKRWKNKITNIEYQGMPKFDDEDEWFDHVNDVEVLEMYCPHNGNKCTKGYKHERKCSLASDAR